MATSIARAIHRRPGLSGPEGAFVQRSGRANRIVAVTIRDGTITAKVLAEVRRSRLAPTTLPAKTGMSRREIFRSLDRCERKPNALASEPGKRATALVALAMSGSRPSATRTGKETRVPPPA